MLLKLHGKKVFFHFRGSEIRLASEFERLNPFHYVNDESGRLFRRLPDATKIRLRDMLLELCDGVFVTDPELQTYVPQATIVPRALHVDEWDYVGVEDRKTPIIVHAPSRRGVKGTGAFLEACESLAAEGLRFEVKLAEGLPHVEARKLYEDADILVDQLRIGWYGVLGCEGMALGKPVVAYIRDDLWDAHGVHLPIINANPNTVKDRLRELILSTDMRRAASVRSREFFLKTHCSVSIARGLADLYRQPSQVMSVMNLANHLDKQHERSLLTMVAARHVTFSDRVGHLREVAGSEGTMASVKLMTQFVKRRMRLN